MNNWIFGKINEDGNFINDDGKKYIYIENLEKTKVYNKEVKIKEKIVAQAKNNRVYLNDITTTKAVKYRYHTLSKISYMHSLMEEENEKNKLSHMLSIEQEYKKLMNNNRIKLYEIAFFRNKEFDENMSSAYVSPYINQPYTLFNTFVDETDYMINYLYII